MFAGGITVAGASFMPMAEMPEAIAAPGSSGTLSVSNTHIMGGAVLAVTISDPAIVATDQQITPPAVSLGTQSLDMTQMTDGTWVGYVVDHETVMNLDSISTSASPTTDTGLEYGVYCDSGLGAQHIVTTNGATASATATASHHAKDFDITTNPSFYQGFSQSGTNSAYDQSQHYCTDTVDAGTGAAATASTDAGGQIKFSVLTDPAALNTNSGTGTNNSGNRNIVVNSTNSFISAWPFIQALNFTSSMDVSYGSESVTVNWGNDRPYGMTADRVIVPDNAEINLTITDSGLNYDPTATDVWIMDAANETLAFWNNGSVGDDTGAAHSAAAQDSGSTVAANAISNDGTQNPNFSVTGLGHVCNNDCTMSVGGSPKKVLGVNNGSASAYGWMNITLTETGINSGVFTASLTSGQENIGGSDAAVDSSMTLTYGDTVSFIIGYENASIALEAGDSWLPVETADFTLTDADANKSTTTTETLSIGNPADRIPTIVIGDPLTLGENVMSATDPAATGTNGKVRGAGGTVALNNEGVVASFEAADQQASTAGDGWYKTMWSNTSDSSERLKIVINGIENGILGVGGAMTPPEEGIATQTWVNITTGIAASQLVDLEGTALLSYDVTSIADALGSTDINVLMTSAPAGTGQNGTVSLNSDNSGHVICIESRGNVKAGIYDMDDLTGGDDCAPNQTTGDYNSAAQRVGVHGITDVFGSTNSASQADLISYAFKFTHPASAHLSSNDTCSGEDCYGEYAIAVDIINFDHDNSSKSHNAIYRMEAVETGDNTGVFTGTVAYAIMNNSTSQDAASGTDPSGSTGFTRGGHDGNPDFVTSGSDPGITPTVSGSDLVLLLGDGGETPRISYNDSDVTAAGDIIAAQLDTVDHSGTAEFDAVSYGAGDTATITITDADLNQDSGLRETYTNSSGTFQVMIGDDDSVLSSDQIIIETGADTGVFVGSFVVSPSLSTRSLLGTDMELQYYDSVDATGGDSTIYGVSQLPQTSALYHLTHHHTRYHMIQMDLMKVTTQ